VRHFPAFHDLRDRVVLVVGDTTAAERRRQLVSAAGARVRVRLAGLVDPGDFVGAALAFAATGDEVADHRVALAARQAGVPINVADRPAQCDFILPAIVNRDPMIVAISSGGASPTLATLLRAEIEATLPAGLGRLARAAEALRDRVAAALPASADRRAFWRRWLRGANGGLALSADRSEIQARTDAALRVGPSIGIAHIVGAGPGDPDLLTLRALRCLQEADVILHDHLVPPAILDRARREAERIAVGKRKNAPGWRQADIERELVARVKRGQIVVRLKSGDPFVFGRGGEEVDALRREGLPWTVVPGVTAALGCAAAVGIPLTDRRHASSVTLLSGHGAGVGAADGWPASFAPDQTLVVYMGASEAASVRDRMLARGLAAATPVAIVESGTRAGQRLSTGTLADLPRLAAPHVARGGAGPTLIVVGAVASLAGAEPRYAPAEEVA